MEKIITTETTVKISTTDICDFKQLQKEKNSCLLLSSILYLRQQKNKIMRRLEFASLQVRDLEVSKNFYTNKLGFEISEMSNPYAYVFKYNNGDASFAIRTPMANIDDKELGVGVQLWFAIDGTIEDLQTDLTSKGIEILGTINTTPFGKTLVVKDPDSYTLTFLQPNA